MKEIIDFIVLIVIYIFIFYKKWKSQGKDVLYFTLMPIITSLPFIFNHSYTPMNLVPFIDVTFGRGDFARQIVLNIIMTIPFGFLLPLIKKENTKLLKVAFYTFLLSLSIEILQPLINGCRSSDITDLITNILGGIIGYIMYLILNTFTTKILNYIKNI